MHRIAFDNNKYIKLQSEHIKERIASFDNKLYLEFGGKLFDDNHASRVLPGFKPDSKLQMLLALKEHVEIIIAVSAHDIEKNKVRSDLGITYDAEVLRLIDAFRLSGLFVGSVCITQYSNQQAALAFKKRLGKLGVKCYFHYIIDGYPYNLDLIVSKDGFGKNQYVETEKPLVVVTAPGPGSGKMAVCLSQLYHDHENGLKSGYAKFETFPIWNLSVKHPVNLAYEAATADLNDVIMIDPYHLEAYNEVTVNYNRDIEVFPVLNSILTSISGKSIYQSPTDMGVNMIGYCIIDDDVVQESAKAEIIRRYYRAVYENIFEDGSVEAVSKIEGLMKQLDISTNDRKVVQAALDKAKKTSLPALAIELEDGQIICAKTTPLLSASAALLLNALKYLAGIEKKMLLLSPSLLEPVTDLKLNSFGNTNPRLHADEILIVLSIAATNNPFAQLALKQIPRLKNCEVHSSVLLSPADEYCYSRLGINLTSEAISQAKKLYRK
ncbi:MAG: DUF1846 domain-containing protein [Erysipelotrichaceae bacterium]